MKRAQKRHCKYIEDGKREELMAGEMYWKDIYVRLSIFKRGEKVESRDQGKGGKEVRGGGKYN